MLVERRVAFISRDPVLGQELERARSRLLAIEHDRTGVLQKIEFDECVAGREFENLAYIYLGLQQRQIR